MTRLEADEVQVDGYPLGSDTVRARLEAEPETDRGHRLRDREVPHATSEQEWGGRDLPGIAFVLTFDGPASDVKDWVDFTLDRLEASDPDDHATLEAGSVLWRDRSRLPVRVQSPGERPVAPGDGDRFVRVEIQATVLGQWAADGGAYAAPITGWFKKTATGWERHDGTTFTDAEGPRIRVPDQYTGYPKLVKRSSLEDAQPPLDATEDVDDDRGVTREYELYDVEDFLHPSVPAEGEVAWYHGEQAPSPSWLAGRLPPRITARSGSRIRAIAQVQTP